MAETVEKTDGEEIVEKEDIVLELAIHHARNRSYPSGLSKEKKKQAERELRQWCVIRERCLFRRSSAE